MADYFPLISRAVAGLAPNTKEAREAIYARAREALTRQLSSLDPPIPDADLWRERDALEETVRRVESQHLQAQPVSTVRPVAPPPRPVAPPRPAEAAAGPPPVAAGLPPRAPAPVAPAPVAPARAVAEEGDGPGRKAPVVIDTTETDAPAPAVEPRRPRVEGDATRAFGGRRAAAITIVLPAMIALGVAAYVMRDDPAMFQPREQAAPAADPAAAQRKSEGRLDGAAPATPATGPRPGPTPQAVPALPVSARAVFFEETANDPRGAQSDGQVIWRLETAPGAGGQPPRTAIRGSATFPAANMALEIVFNRNRDQTLPASHTVELVFRPEGDRPGVTEIGPIEARDQEAQPGYQLRGVMVPIAANLFLVGLENVPLSLERNLESLRDQRFFAFQFRMSNSKVGALLLEKGTTGDRVFREAIEAWSRG